MAVSRPLQVFPPGLLGFLQLKNNGKNPSDFPDTLQAVLELRDWILQFGAEDLPVGSVAVAGGTTGGNVFTTQPLTVPDDQWWFVHTFFVRAGGLVATDAVAFCAAWFSTPLANPNSQHVLTGNFQPLFAGIAGGGRVACAAANPFFAPPGAQLGFLGQANDSAGNVTYQGFARVTRLTA